MNQQVNIPEGTVVEDGQGGKLVWIQGDWRRAKSPPRAIPRRKPDGEILDVAPLMRGLVEIEVQEVQDDGSMATVQVYRDGFEIEPEGEVYDGKNLIVQSAPNIMANVLGGVNPSDNRIGFVDWGTGGHVTGDPATPIPPSPTDLVLETSILQTATVFPPTIGTTFVQFESTMDTATGNGNVFTEAGLLTNVGSLMFARKTFPGITKNSNRTLTIRWIISFLQNSAGCDCQGVGLFGELGPINRHKFTAAGGETSITVPLTWTPGLNRLWVWRNGKRIFQPDAYSEDHPTGITSLSPAAVGGEIFFFEVLE